MSIAVSAVVNPSRLLLAAVGAMCLCIVCSAGMIGFGKVGELSLVVRLLMAGGLVCAAVFGFFQTLLNRKTFRIDISGSGQIRLVEDRNGSAAFSRSGEWSGQTASGEVVQLMADSTIWPRLQLLRLRRPDQRVIPLLILPDCVGASSFRALSVACRWIAAHNNRAGEGEPV
jgi:hypothetical protein